MLTPVVVWGLIVRSGVVEDLGRRQAQERQVMAQIASATVEREMGEARRRVNLLSTRQGFRRALTSGDTGELERHLDDLIRGTTYSTALALGPGGVLLARQPAAPETYGQSFADRDYYSGALATEDVYLSEAVVSRITGEALVVVALAVRDGDRVLGLVLLTVTPAQLLSALAPLRSIPGREIAILDQRSRVIASSDAQRVPMSQLAVPVPGDILYTQTGSVAADLGNAERIVTFAPVASARWALVVMDDPSILLAAERQIQQQLAEGGAATLAIALAAAAGIAWLFAKTRRQAAVIEQREVALERTNAALAEASRHKSEFVAGMSHELRTPLNAILGFTDLLDEQLADATSDRQKRYLRNIREAGEHLLGLINDVLDLAKVEAGRTELRPDVTTIAALTEPVVASASGAARERGVEFVPVVDAAVAVCVDAGRVRQILYNLVSNAVKFTPPGGTVRLAVTQRERDLVIEVADTGLGIPADKRDRVFVTFERLHEGRSDAAGTGLGLSLTKQLVDLHHGSISFESVEGRGTTFRVVLPDAIADVSRRDRVLVVEDDRRDADLIVALAGKSGLATEVVGSVASALAAIERAIPIAVVLDLQLPDGRGDTVLDALRSGAATRAVPTIVVTVEDDIGVSRGLGAHDHLTKPIDPKRLATWLQSIAARSRPPEEVGFARPAG